MPQIQVVNMLNITFATIVVDIVVVIDEFCMAKPNAIITAKPLI